MATPYDELTGAIRAYGKAAMTNLLRCKALGYGILEGFAGWLGCDGERVVCVPATGPFDPRHDYGDAAYSFHQQAVIRLEPITVGVCLIVDNVEDSGSIWLRTGLRIEISGDTFDVFVGGQPVVHVPLDFEGHLDPVFKAIHAEMMGVFARDLAEFKDERVKGKIGFVSD